MRVALSPADGADVVLLEDEPADEGAAFAAMTERELLDERAADAAAARLVELAEAARRARARRDTENIAARRGIFGGFASRPTTGRLADLPVAACKRVNHGLLEQKKAARDTAPRHLASGGGGGGGGAIFAFNQ